MEIVEQWECGTLFYVQQKNDARTGGEKRDSTPTLLPRLVQKKTAEGKTSTS